MSKTIRIEASDPDIFLILEYVATPLLLQETFWEYYSQSVL